MIKPRQHPPEPNAPYRIESHVAGLRREDRGRSVIAEVDDEKHDWWVAVASDVAGPGGRGFVESLDGKRVRVTIEILGNE